MITNFFKPVTEHQTPPQCSRESLNAQKMFDSKTVHAKSVNVGNTLQKRKWPFPTNNLKKNTFGSQPSRIQSSSIRKSTWKQGNPSFAARNPSTLKRSSIPPFQKPAFRYQKSSISSNASSTISEFPDKSLLSKPGSSFERKSSRTSNSTNKYVLLEDYSEEEDKDYDFGIDDESDDEDQSNQSDEEEDSDSYDEANELENLKDFCLSDRDESEFDEDEEEEEDDEEDEEDEEEDDEEDEEDEEEDDEEDEEDEEE